TSSDTIAYIFDSLYTFVSSSPAPISINRNVLKWSFTSLQPFEEMEISIQFHLDSSVALGTTLYDTAFIYPISNDTTPTNNISAISQIVLGAFDPNEKTVTKDSFVDPSDTLIYTIFFQNTGTLSATNVVIRDTLDSNLDPNSFRVLGSSHYMTYKIKNNGIIEFDFSNINLPDSNSNEPQSHGYVRYSVKVKDNTPIGTRIQNTASIYFDFNSTIVTNTAKSYVGIGVPSNVSSVATNSIIISPNPSNGKFTLTSNVSQSGVIEVYNITGEKVFAQNVSSLAKVSFDISQNAKGVYLVKVSNAENVWTQRVIVE
ncbi:MAG TPA: T9SS type A sorting domain-containing protein, partial [Chitinophagales bacterium]